MMQKLPLSTKGEFATVGLLKNIFKIVLALPEIYSLPCKKKARQRLPGTRQRICRVKLHGIDITAHLGSAKNLCHALSTEYDGKHFAVCFPSTTRHTIVRIGSTVKPDVSHVCIIVVN